MGGRSEGTIRRLNRETEMNSPDMEHCTHGEENVGEIPVEEDEKVKPKQKLDLESMLERITPENLHPEFDAGPPVGNEFW